MSLSYDLISEFVKITNDKKQNTKEGTVYATIVSGTEGKYVKIDGSDLLTPTDTTTDIEDGERVTLMIKDHKAIVTGNITTPSASTSKVNKVNESVNSVSDRVGTFELVVADKVSTKELEAYKANIEILVANKATIEDLTVTNAKIKNLEVKNAEIENLVAEKATITDLEAVNATIENLKAKDAEIQNAVIENLDATMANIKILNADFAQIKTLVNGNLTSDNILSFNLTSEKVTVDDAFIKDAMIDTISAGKINAGKINTNWVSIGSEDGGMLITGSTQQFTDKNGNVRIQIGKDASGDFTFILYGEDGTGQLINQNGITASAIGDGLIVNNMVSDNAAISGGKLDISSVITEINGDTSTTIKSSKIYLNEQAQSLEVAFNSLKTKVDTIQEVTIQGDLTAIVDQVQSNTTKIEANTESISTLISENTTIKKEVTDLQGTLNETETTLTSKYTSLDQSLQGFKTTVADTYATKKSVTDVVDNISANYSTTSVMNSAIEQKVEELSLSVSNTYATKNEVNTLDDNLKTNYSTTKQMESAISVAKEEINLGVSSIYETKENTTSKITTAKQQVIESTNNTLNSTIANYYTKGETDSQIDVAKKEINLGVSQIYETKTEVTNKINNIQVDVQSAIGTKANTSDVYNKSEVYTREETDSQINVAKNEINLGVFSTYETKTEATNKMNNAIYEARHVMDTRDTNENPRWYLENYPRQTITEFKQADIIGLPNNGIGYYSVTTTIPWADPSGGRPTQAARTSTSEETYERVGISDTEWSAWIKIENASSAERRVTSAKEEMRSEINIAKDAITNTVRQNFYTKEETNNQITSQGYATTSQVQQTANDVTFKFTQSGGYNFVRNGNAKNGQAHWNAYYLPEASWGVRNDDWTGYEPAIQISAPDGATNTNAVYQIVNGLITGETYSFSALVAGHRGTNRLVIINGEGNTEIGWSDEATDYYGNTNISGWKRVSGTFVATGSTCHIRLCHYNGWANSFGWFKQIQINRGSIPLPYSPHPSEIYDGITTIDRDGINVATSYGAHTQFHSGGMSSYNNSDQRTLGIENGGVSFHSWNNNALSAYITQSSLWSGNLSANGLAISTTANGTYVALGTSSLSDVNTTLNMEQALTISASDGFQPRGINFWKDVHAHGYGIRQLSHLQLAGNGAIQFDYLHNSPSTIYEEVDNGHSLYIMGGYQMHLGVMEGSGSPHAVIWMRDKTNTHSYTHWDFHNYTMYNMKTASTYANYDTRRISESYGVTSNVDGVRYLYKNVELVNGKAIRSVPLEYKGCEYDIVSIVCKGRGSAWVETEDENRFEINGECKSVNIEIIIYPSEAVMTASTQQLEEAPTLELPKKTEPEEALLITNEVI